jgi:hypothetical protein
LRGLDWFKYNTFIGKYQDKIPTEQWTAKQWKTGIKDRPFKGRTLVRERGKMKKVKKDKYGWCIFYTRINIEHWNLLKLFYEREWGWRESNGEDESNQYITYVYMGLSQ